MLFNSYIFILFFLPITLAGYFYFCHSEENSYRKIFLVTASFLFYAYWSSYQLILFLISILINYFIGLKIQATKEKIAKKHWLQLGLFFNILYLSYFKYKYFLLDNFNFIFQTDFHLNKVALPLAISFFSIQQVAYLVDIYEGLTHEKKLLDYSLFVSFFPRLTAGPIVHHKEIMSQLNDPSRKEFLIKNISLGLYLFIIGLAKKLLIADTFSDWVFEGFDQYQKLHFFHAWGTSLSYCFQIYFDFSGYSDMAIGVGYLFNIKIPKNFNSPLASKNIVEFWSKWHITLTNFITVYIFTPILRAFSKPTFSNSMIAMFLAMLIAGLWHGAAWTFVLFGGLHGAGIVCVHILKKKKIKIPQLLSKFITFNFINICFVFFRAQNINDAFKVLKGMFGWSGIQFPKGIFPTNFLHIFNIKIGEYMNNQENLELFMIGLCLYIVFKTKNSMQLADRFQPSQKLAILSGLLLAFCLLGLNQVSKFIYFNF